MFERIVKDNISRVVAFVFAPLLLIVVPPVVNAINAVLGTGYSNQELSNLAIATIVGAALALYKWLANRGRYEIAAVEKVLTQVHAEGTKHMKSEW